MEQIIKTYILECWKIPIYEDCYNLNGKPKDLNSGNRDIKALCKNKPFKNDLRAATRLEVYVDIPNNQIINKGAIIKLINQIIYDNVDNLSALEICFVPVDSVVNFEIREIRFRITQGKEK
ncbi:MAG: hypothetical protein ACRCZK_01800 [Oscillospiraceae bacterium]